MMLTATKTWSQDQEDGPDERTDVAPTRPLAAAARHTAGPGVWNEVAGHLPGQAWVPDITPVPGTADPQRRLAEHLVRKAAWTDGDRWRVVGHSFGGQVALEMAALAGHLVDELTIVCSRDTPYLPFAAAADNLDSGGPIDTEAAIRRWFRPAEIDARPAFAAGIAAILQGADRRSWATALRGIATFDAVALTRRIAAPARVIAAEYDAVASPGVMRQMAQRLPAAEFVVLTAAAHMSAFLDPARLAAMICRRTGVR